VRVIVPLKKNGICNTTDGQCTCNPPYDGVSCSLITCPGDCIHNSSCDPQVGICRCAPGWTGPVCALVGCPSDCNSAAGNGQCVGGVCNCNGRWSGASCSVQLPDYVFIALLAIGLGLGGLVLIVGAFFIWRQVMISNLSKKLEEQKGDDDGDNLQEISSSDSD